MYSINVWSSSTSASYTSPLPLVGVGPNTWRIRNVAQIVPSLKLRPFSRV